MVDCGCYVGGFAMSAAKLAGSVHVFEPESNNIACIQRNLAAFDNVSINELGLYSETRELILNVAESSVEHSILKPDVGSVLEERQIAVTRIDDYCRTQGIGQIDFFKVEAEGVEFEVLEGLGDQRPRKIAVDVSPERDNESPVEMISSWLMDRGYEVQTRLNVLFAKALN